MDDNVNKILETLPKEVSEKFFTALNEGLKDICTEESPLNPLENAEVMYRCTAQILCNYIMNMVEPPLREYVSSRMLFHFAIMLGVQIQTWEATKAAQDKIDNIGAV